jgi:hypothetical protein
MPLDACTFTAEWSVSFPLFWLKRGGRSKRNDKSKSSVEPSARFLAWTGACKARDALRTDHRNLPLPRLIIRARRSAFQAVNGCAAHPNDFCATLALLQPLSFSGYFAPYHVIHCSCVFSVLEAVNTKKEKEAWQQEKSGKNREKSYRRREP